LDITSSVTVPFSVSKNQPNVKIQSNFAFLLDLLAQI